MDSLTAIYKSGVSSLPFGSPGEAGMSKTKKSNKGNGKVLRIGTWNVKTMAQQGKINNAFQEMKIIKLDILGVIEMRWPNSGTVDIEDYKIYYSGTQNGLHENGIGIIVHKNIAKSMSNFIPISERIIITQINVLPVNINLI